MCDAECGDLRNREKDRAGLDEDVEFFGLGRFYPASSQTQLALLRWIAHTDKLDVEIGLVSTNWQYFKVLLQLSEYKLLTFTVNLKCPPIKATATHGNSREPAPFSCLTSFAHSDCGYLDLLPTPFCKLLHVFTCNLVRAVCGGKKSICNQSSF